MERRTALPTSPTAAPLADQTLCVFCSCQGTICTVTGISTVAPPGLGAAKMAAPTRACMHESDGAGMPCDVRSEVESTSPAEPTTANSLALAPVWSDVGSVARAL